ncbi:HAMP domain-containing histidine kinase [Myxococcota bacterium]|nr:HAMP domain-containing histidine kinase [Myxococcota bacterium]
MASAVQTLNRGNSGDGRGRAETATALRTAVTRLAGASNGSVLLFARDGDTGALRLRSAAGVSSPEAARSVAESVLPAVQDAARDGRPSLRPALPALGGRGAGGISLLPLASDGMILGVLVVATPASPAGPVLQVLDLAAEAMTARLALGRDAEEREQLQRRVEELEQAAGDKSDEVLKLSEALFAQDVELLRSQERLGQVEKLKSDFIEKMSRELRTPLNGIIESIIAVLAGENDVLSESAQQALRHALDDGTAFLRTLQNIIDLWRIKQGEMSAELADVNFREVVEEAIFSVQDTIGSNPVTIEKHFEEPLPKIRTDLAKVNQILFLLLDNAAKFTQQGRIGISARVDGGMLHGEIKDSGIGICPDDQQFIFDEFYQVDELASAKYRGSGLGLALVRDLIKLLDGSIDVSSEVGSGTTFRFRIPVQLIG